MARTQDATVCAINSRIFFPGSAGRHTFVRRDEHRKFVMSTIRPGGNPGWPIAVVCIDDDHRHRVVLIDPKAKSVVGRYGADLPWTPPGLLYTPDGTDFPVLDGTAPTQPSKR